MISAGDFERLIIANNGSMSNVAKAIGVSRQTLYKWIDKDSELKAIKDNAKEVLIDFAEDALIRLINKGNVTAIIFFLKTKGKSRGYIEKMETEITPLPIVWKEERYPGH